MAKLINLIIHDMSKVCELCGKKSMIAVTRMKLRGKYNPTGTKRKYPNLQPLQLGPGKRVRACVQCRKTRTKKERAK